MFQEPEKSEKVEKLRPNKMRKCLKSLEYCKCFCVKSFDIVRKCDYLMRDMLKTLFGFCDSCM